MVLNWTVEPEIHRASALGRSLSLCLLATLSLTNRAVAEDAPSFQPRCVVERVDGQPQATCETGAIPGGRVTHVLFRKEGTTGQAEALYVPFAGSGKVAAVLYVVDRADRRRQRVVGLAGADSARLIEAARVAGPSYRFGIAQISERLEMMAPIGAPRDEILRVAAALKADGVVTDGGRLLGEAIAQLKAIPADRHVLVLASDGKPDDRAYGRDDVVRTARQANVPIVTLGYRERSDAAELSTLQRLSEETGGFYVEAPAPTNRIDDASINRFAQFVGSGGTARFPLDRSEPRGRYLVTIEFDDGQSITGSFFADVPLSSSGASTAAPSRAGAGEPARGAALSDPSWVGAGSFSSWMTADWRQRSMIFVTVALFVTLGAGAAAVFFVARSRSRQPVRAWLELADAARTRIAVVSDSVRIGRHSENEIRLRNQSVHRYHAVLHLDRGTGRFLISDVSHDQPRSNGVVVNGELVRQSELTSGDTIELGEVRMKFIYA